MSKRTVSKTNSKVAVAYLRVSTDRQELGPEAQRACIEAWAAREGVEVVAWHFDKGVSGGTDLAERPALVAAIGELRAAGAGVFVIAKRDRLARDTLVAGLIGRAVEECGAVVVSADGVGNGEDPASQFMRSILDAAAQYERALIRSRIRAALAVKASRSERVGAVSYGFELGADGKTLVSHAGEQEVIRIARELRTTGMSLRDIAAELSTRGMLARNGGAFAATQIARMMAA
jgi:DNA invertase Pin-like site-specific DNA recombinase